MILLAPVYQPGDGLVTFVTELREQAPDIRVVIVDDGSDGVCAPVFHAARQLGCTTRRTAAREWR